MDVNFQSLLVQSKGRFYFLPELLITLSSLLFLQYLEGPGEGGKKLSQVCVLSVARTYKFVPWRVGVSVKARNFL